MEFSDKAKSICSSCAHGYSLYQNFCVKNSIMGCKTELDKKCTECYKPFNLNDNDCTIKNCKVYNDYKCAACECGYFLTSTGICKSIADGCIRYQRGECIDCLPKWTLINNECELVGCRKIFDHKCATCKDEYDLVDGGCVLRKASLLRSE